MKQLDNIISIKEYDIKQQLPNYIIKGIWYRLTGHDEDIIIKRTITNNLSERFMYESSFFHNDYYK